MDISPHDLVEILVKAGIKNWVLMGLHGYVGYLPDPRATQDVDVMIPHSQKKRAVKAIETAWPELLRQDSGAVIRFLDPHDTDSADHAKPVIDIMLPQAPFQETILKEFVVTDEQTGHRIPRLEAALVSKYAAMISPYRDRGRREYDCGDFRIMARANSGSIHHEDLRRLAGLVWEGGSEEIDRFVEIAMSDQPFPL